MPEPRWFPAVYVDGLPTEWWLIESNRLIRAVPYVPGCAPCCHLSAEVTKPNAYRRHPC